MSAGRRLITVIACASVLGGALLGGCGGPAPFRREHGQLAGRVADTPFTVRIPEPGDRWILRDNKRDGVAWALAPKTRDPASYAAPPDGLLFAMPVAGLPILWECVEAGAAGLRACLETTLRGVDFDEIRFDPGAPAETATPAGPAHGGGFFARRGKGRFAGDVHVILVDRAAGVIAIVIGAGATPGAVEAARAAAARLRESIRFERR